MVSKISIEAKYRRIAIAFAEIKWIMSLLKKLQFFFDILVVYYDNLRVVPLVVNCVSHSKSKHFELDLHFVCDQVQQKLVCLLDQYQVSDILTKSLFRVFFFIALKTNVWLSRDDDNTNKRV